MVVELDYLVIGHATRDLRGDSFTIGGTAAYAARAALALGCRVGVITSTDAELDLGRALPGAVVSNTLAPVTTTFENITVDGERHQLIRHVARPLVPAMVPESWRAAIVHIGPVAQECHPALASTFGTAFVGVTPQGWMRHWDEAGQVSHRRWSGMVDVLTSADAVVLSLEDVEGNWDLAAEYAAQTSVLALTQGAQGCTVFADGEARHFPAPEADEEDSTGAGDIFAAAFFYVLQRSASRPRGCDLWAAARFANCMAVQSVAQSGLSSTPNAEEIARCRRATLRSH